MDDYASNLEEAKRCVAQAQELTAKAKERLKALGTKDLEETKKCMEQAHALAEKAKAHFKALGLDYKAVAAVARNNAQIVSETKEPASTRPTAARMRRRGIAL